MTRSPKPTFPGSSNPHPVLDPHAKDAFWSVVEDCLKRFHDHGEARAHQSALDLRRQVESPPPGIDGELIYHDEPFYVACDLAGIHDNPERDRLFEKNRKLYDLILKSRNW
jgi:hypothetical protein